MLKLKISSTFRLPYRKRFIVVLLSLGLFSTTVLADDINPHTKKLDSILNKIQLLEKHLLSHKSKKGNLQKELRKTEINVGNIIETLRKTKKQLNKTTIALKVNKKKQQYYQEQLKIQKKLLANQICTMYKLGKQPFLKIALNQENPEQINRYLYYYKYLNSSRLENIGHIEQTSKTLKETIQQIRQQTQLLKIMHQKQISQQRSLEQEKRHRKNLLQKTEKNIQNEQQQLAKLRADKKRLENIIRTLQQYKKKGGDVSGKNFQYMQHALSQPISGGHLTQRFGQSVNGTALHSTGIVMTAPEGTKVHAVFPGKVVFADWLRGFGLLAIIQHGPDYMTLYGRNQKLYVKTNQLVHAGDVIATTGNSGGFKDSSLYFEVRYKGMPQNPNIWLKSNKITS